MIGMTGALVERIRRNPAAADAYRALALACLGKTSADARTAEEVRAAVWCLRAALSLQPDDRDVRAELSRALFALARWLPQDERTFTEAWAKAEAAEVLRGGDGDGPAHKAQRLLALYCRGG